MAAAIMGSSLKTFPHEAIPRLVVRAILPFKYLWLTTWKRALAASPGSGQVAHFVNDQKARPQVKAHRVGPPALHGGAVAARRQVGGGGVVGAHAGGQGSMAQAHGQHRFADTGRPDQEHVGGVFDKAQGGQLVDQLFVHRGLGRIVEVGQRERRGQGGEAGQAGPAALFDAATSSASSRSKNCWWVALALPARSSSPGKASAAAVIRKKAK